MTKKEKKKDLKWNPRFLGHINEQTWFIPRLSLLVFRNDLPVMSYELLTLSHRLRKTASRWAALARQQAS